MSLKYLQINKACIMLLLLAFPLYALAQSKSELNKKVNDLSIELVKIKKQLQTSIESEASYKEQVLSLEIQLSDIKIELDEYKKQANLVKKENAIPVEKDVKVSATTKSVTPSDSKTTAVRCQALTAKGTQCSRNPSTDSKFCWQHDTTNSTNVKTSSSTSSGSGRTIMTGPRGGKYYINSKGNKVYVK